MTGVEATAVKAAEAVAKWSVARLWRWMRPDISRAALIGYADNLADAVSRRETVLLDQLRGGRDMVIDDLEFRAEHRLRLAADAAAGVLDGDRPVFPAAGDTADGRARRGGCREDGRGPSVWCSTN